MNENLPISKKAYERFCARIKAAHDAYFIDCSAMMYLLDSYLAGRNTCMDDISPVQRFAFLMIIDELDLAMARSARARRPRRKLNKAVDDDTRNDKTRKGKTRKSVHSSATSDIVECDEQIDNMTTASTVDVAGPENDTSVIQVSEAGSPKTVSVNETGAKTGVASGRSRRRSHHSPTRCRYHWPVAERSAHSVYSGVES